MMSLLQLCFSTTVYRILDMKRRDAAPFKAYGDDADVEFSKDQNTEDDDDDEDEESVTAKLKSCMAKVTEGTINLRQLRGEKGVPR